MSSGSESSAKPQVWFLDTSALVTLAVHNPLQRAVLATLSVHRRVLTTAVQEELRGLARTSSTSAEWADVALTQLEWLGEAVPLDDPAGTRLAVEIQEHIAAGRPLRHEMEHFGEASIISMASRAQTLRPLMLSDDYDARIAAKSRDVESMSIHKLLHIMIKQAKVTQAQAAGFADALYRAGRAQDYTAAELAAGRIGRVGLP
jgi:hypothetical protein